jgi:expansin (peptidoglycan-binding protein)
LSQTPDQGTSIDVSLTDRCTGCAYGDLDFSPAAFDQFAKEAVGRIYGIQWEIID